MRHDEQGAGNRQDAAREMPKVEGLWDQENGTQPTDTAQSGQEVTLREEHTLREAGSRSDGRGSFRLFRHGKRKLLALCGAVVALAALFVVFCGVALLPQGTVGAAGEPGKQGEQGIPGPQGPQGIQGEQGAKGEPGEPGETGAPGEKGDKGDQGEQGLQGEQGIPGIPGAPGKSAYEIYCEQYGYTGSEEEWMREVHDRLSRPSSQEIYAMAESCVVTIEAFRAGLTAGETSLGKGSGFFIDPNGLIMTAYHVIDGATSIRVSMADSAVYEVLRVVAFDRERDLAILRIGTSRTLPYLTLETEGVTPGETVYAIGGVQGSTDGVFAMGVAASGVSADGAEQAATSFRYTCALPNGNGGAPILNAYGRVVGVASRAASDDGDEGSGNLHTAAYIGGLEALDVTYDSTVQDFFEDTEYFRVKWMEEKQREMENNNTMKATDYIDTPGQTFVGTARKDDPDYFSFEVSGLESADVTLLYSVDTTDFYYPILIPASGTNIELSWVPLERDGGRIYCARVTLAPGIYYIAVNGHYSDRESAYGLYTYWRPLTQREAFAYEVSFEDAVR